MRFGETRNLRHAAAAAPAKSCPKRKFNWLRAPAVMGCCSATQRIALRKGGGNLTEVWPNNLAFRCGGAPEMRASATSMPSAEVPDITPRTNMGFLSTFNFCLSLQNPTVFFIFKIRESSRKARQEGTYTASEDSLQRFGKGNFLAIKEVSLAEALKTIFGRGIGTFLSCLPGRLAYFEDEEDRWILERKAKVEGR